MTFRTVARRGYHNIFPKGFLSYILSLGVDIVYKLDETSGTVAVNYGRIASAGNANNVNSIQIAQSGPIGTTYNNAYNYTAINNVLEIPNSASLNTFLSATSYTFGFLIFPRTSGISPGTSSRIYSLTSSSSFQSRFNTNLNSIIATIDGNPTDALTTTTTGVIQNVWQWLFYRFNYQNSQLIDIFTYRTSLVEATYSPARTALSGVRPSSTGQTFNIGNQAAVNSACDWKIAGGSFFTTTAFSNDVLSQIGRLTKGLS